MPISLLARLIRGRMGRKATQKKTTLTQKAKI